MLCHQAYVHKFVTQRVKEASASILELGGRYVATMSGALDQHRQGELCALSLSGAGTCAAWLLPSSSPCALRAARSEGMSPKAD